MVFSGAELLEQMEGLLQFDDVFNAIAFSGGSTIFRTLDPAPELDNLFWLWTLSCEYGMHSLRSKVEDFLSKGNAAGKRLASFGDASAEAALNVFSSRGYQYAAISLLTILRQRDETVGKELAERSFNVSIHPIFGNLKGTV